MTDSALLSLVQWLSPAFPVGGYAYSHGLEWAISHAEVTSADTLRDWIATVIGSASGRTDAIVLGRALMGDDPAMLTEVARALAASQERWTETLDQGTALTATTNALTGTDWPAMPYPVALGVAARPLGLPVRQVIALFLHGFASNLVQAGVRFVPLGQTEGQRVLAALHPLIEATATELDGAGLEALASGGFRSDLAAMAHETMDTRIFRT